MKTETTETPSETLAPQRRIPRTLAERVAMGIMALGFFMLFQPFVQALFTYSFTVILIGTICFIVAVHLPE